MIQEISQQIATACLELFGSQVSVTLTRTDEQFGDFSTNVALQLAKPLTRKPREIAEELAVKLRETLTKQVAEVSVAGPGFINLTLTSEALLDLLDNNIERSLEGQTIVAEYSDPNPFKVLHAGHLYTSLVGDAVARLMEQAGATVKRANFGGDVGLHVGKTMWAIRQVLDGDNPDKLSQVPATERLNWLSQRYVAGNTAYEEDPGAKSEITAINKQVYELHKSNDRDTSFAQIYWTCRQWSYDGFDELYKQLGMKPFDKYYPESEVADLGLETVREHIGPVYQKSDGAVIFKGEDYNLFTQVFINSEGLPTYAAKDVGLIFQKQADFNPDKSFIITDHAQKDHLAVVMTSIGQFAPELVAATTHYTHGQIKMAGGVKMSSRLGNVLRANDILNTALLALKENNREPNDVTYLGAVKYAFLKNRIGSDIVYDPAESVSLEGNSGPYLQYAHARARSVLRKVEAATRPIEASDLQAGERSLVRKIGEYTEVVNRSVDELMPHHVCNYLYELAQTFNRFYENNRVIDDPRQSLRLNLVERYASTLKSGLGLLGIEAPEKM